MRMEAILNVKFYRSSAADEPVRAWLKEEVSADAREAIGGDIKTVQLGWPLGMPLVRRWMTGCGRFEVRSLRASHASCSLPYSGTWCCCTGS